MLGEQSKKEYHLIMTGTLVLFTVIIFGEIIPTIEIVATYLVIAAIGYGLVAWVTRLIREAREWHHVMYAPIEELLKEEQYSKDTALRECLPDDYDE